MGARAVPVTRRPGTREAQTITRVTRRRSRCPPARPREACTYRRRHVASGWMPPSVANSVAARHRISARALLTAATASGTPRPSPPRGRRCIDVRPRASPVVASRHGRHHQLPRVGVIPVAAHLVETTPIGEVITQRRARTSSAISSDESLSASLHPRPLPSQVVIVDGLLQIPAAARQPNSSGWRRRKWCRVLSGCPTASKSRWVWLGVQALSAELDRQGGYLQIGGTSRPVAVGIVIAPLRQPTRSVVNHARPTGPV